MSVHFIVRLSKYDIIRAKSVHRQTSLRCVIRLDTRAAASKDIPSFAGEFSDRIYEIPCYENRSKEGVPPAHTPEVPWLPIQLTPKGHQGGKTHSSSLTCLNNGHL